ncbi:MAG TPA: class I SAM-dependent methyltransferase [Mycobacteriales bacterium]|nr:class I SAM-dependent methyltransferase [Mycobacteriales bacterium]
MKQVDYDGAIHRNYHAGRALNAENARAWLAAFAGALPLDRPLNGLDLGSGTGRFTPLLAAEFGPVLGVEPAAGMRAVAVRESAHPQARYVAGSATAIPAAGAAFDYGLLFLVWHHVADKASAAAEIARVIRPGGTLLLRAQFSDHMPRLWWLRHFPGGPELDASLYRPLATEIETFAAAGFTAPDLRQVYEPARTTRAERLERLRHRSLSIFEHMSEEQLDTGFASLTREVAADPDAVVPEIAGSLLVLTRAG